MGGHENQSSDKGAAFVGLVGGALLIGLILYGTVLWTNASFAKHKAEKATGSVAAESLRVG